MNNNIKVALKALAAFSSVGFIWVLKGCIHQRNVQGLYESTTIKFNSYQTINETLPPEIIRYKFDLYRTIEEETGYWSDYNGLLISQIQQRKLTEFKKSLPENPDNWSADQKETYDYAVKSMSEFINTDMPVSKYIQALKEDLNNFKVDINQPSNTTNTSTQIPDAVKLSMRHNFAVKSRG